MFNESGSVETRMMLSTTDDLLGHQQLGKVEEILNHIAKFISEEREISKVLQDFAVCVTAYAIAKLYVT